MFRSARATPTFQFAPYSGPLATIVDLDSFKEWVQDGGQFLDRATPANRRYSGSERREIRILASPYGRSGRVTMLGGLFPGDSADMVRLGWYGQTPSVIVSGASQGGALPALMELAQTGTKSMMNPGLNFYFDSGPTATLGSESEARGVDIDTLRVNFSTTIGESVPSLFQPYQRALIMLNGGGTVVNLRLPARTNAEGVTVNAWLDSPSNPNASQFSIWIRCGTLPTAMNYHQRRYFAPNVPVYIRSTDDCSGDRFVSIASEPGAPVVVMHLTAQAHKESQVTAVHRVGIPFNPTATEFAGIKYGFKSAAWRLYGATEGTRIITSFMFYKNDRCSTGPTPGCGSTQANLCSVCLDTQCDRGSFEDSGKVYLCGADIDRLRSSSATEIDAWYGPARLLAHEFGHALLGLPDEYSGVCGYSTGLCGHSIMELQYNNINGLCNSANHRQAPEYRTVAPHASERILGTFGFACGTNVAADATSAWARWSPSTPYNGPIPLIQQNVEYVRQGFTVRQDIGQAFEN